MKYKFIVFFCCISNVIFAQLNYNKSTWYIKANASSLIDIFTFPTVQLSVEKQLGDNFSLSTEAGYQLYSFNRSDTAFLNPTGFKVNLEGRYYLSKFINVRFSEKTGRVYIGLRPFYYQNKNNASITYKTDKDSPDWIDDDFTTESTAFGVNLIYGFQKSITDKLIMDMHFGLGIMNKQISNTELQYKEDAGYILAGTDFIKYFKSLNLSESSGIRGNILVGFRVGYKIYK